MDLNSVAEIALTAGEILFENGAETYRIEETVSSICRSYGYSAECMSMSDGIILTIESPRTGNLTAMKKAGKKQFDLYRIELINSFSRQMQNETLPYSNAMERLREIKNAPNFTMTVRTLAACMTGFVYTLFFSGTILDGTAALFICFATYTVLERIKRMGFFQFLEYYLAGLIIGGGSLLINALFPAVNQNNVITGSIMILLPGVVLTNGIKDVIYGNFTAGVARFFEAVIIIGAVGLGVITTLYAAIAAR